MRIENLSEKHFDEMCNLYFENFMNPEDSVELLKDFQRDMDLALSFVAVNDAGSLMGGILCKVNEVPYWGGKILHVQAIQVKKQFQGSGAGKLLFRSALDAAKKTGIKGVSSMLRRGKRFL